MTAATLTILPQHVTREHVSTRLERLRQRRTDRWTAPWALRTELELIVIIVELIDAGEQLSDLAIERLAVATLRIQTAARCCS